MNRLSPGRLVGLSLLLVPLVAFSKDDLRDAARAHFSAPLEAPSPSALSAPDAVLGRALFWDVRISGDGKTACATCHLSSAWGADTRPQSIDAHGKTTARHSPTVFNSMSQPALRWLADRASGAILAEGLLTAVMGFKSKDEAVAAMKASGYDGKFADAYPGQYDPVTPANYARALQAYQATLATPASLDRYLAGDDAALPQAARKGMRAFIDTGCATCHRGPLLGGSMLQKFGLVKDYWLETGSAKPDLGRFAATQKEEDKYVFRVPMLRNVAKTAPYFHDGSVATLDRAVRVMASVQLGRALDDETVASIVAFLDSLSGPVPAHFAPPAKQ